MYKKFDYAFFVFTICAINCANEQTSSPYTKEQINSLHLESTRNLNATFDSAIMINLNPFLKQQAFDFGSLVKEVKLIPLETTDAGLLDDINKVIVTDSSIYVYDDFKGGGIVVFNNQGKFIRRIPNGKGPGELIRLYDIDFDDDNDELIAYQHSYLLFYTPEGDFIRQMKIPFGFYNFAAIPDGYIFKTLEEQNNHLGIWNNFTLFITDKAFRLKSAGLPYNSPKVSYTTFNYLSHNHSLHITQKFCDTIYQYVSGTNELRAQYILNYHKKKFPDRSLFGEFEEFMNVARQNDYYYFLGDFLDTEDYQFIMLKNNFINESLVIYRNKKTGNIQGGTSADYNLQEIPPMAFPRAAKGKYFISWYEPVYDFPFATQSSIISEEDKQKIKALKKEDNPVLTFFTLKNF